MLVKDGDTTVIGGIYVRRGSTLDAPVPFLGEDPRAGLLLQEQPRVGDRQELLIFITPRILNRQTIAQTPLEASCPEWETHSMKPLFVAASLAPGPGCVRRKHRPSFRSSRPSAGRGLHRRGGCPASQGPLDLRCGRNYVLGLIVNSSTTNTPTTYGVPAGPTSERRAAGHRLREDGEAVLRARTGCHHSRREPCPTTAVHRCPGVRRGTSWCSACSTSDAVGAASSCRPCRRRRTPSGAGHHPAQGQVRLGPAARSRRTSSPSPSRSPGTRDAVGHVRGRWVPGVTAPCGYAGPG